MLLVDERTGSKELLKPLLNRGVPAEITHLMYGDFAIPDARGVLGAELTVGVELKVTTDLVASLNRGRFTGHQLKGLLTTYDRVWLLTEGDWRRTDEGLLTYRTFGRTYMPVRPPTMMRDLYARLLNLQVRGGLHYWHARDREETIDFLVTLHHYWTDKDLDEHKSHLGAHNRDVDRNLFVPTSQFVETIRTLPGVDTQRARAAEKHFKGCLTCAINASAEEWALIETIDRKQRSRKFGLSAASKMRESYK